MREELLKELGLDEQDFKRFRAVYVEKMIVVHAYLQKDDLHKLQRHPKYLCDKNGGAGSKIVCFRE